MNPVLKEMIGASRLDARTYEDLEANPKRTIASIFVVVAASVAAGLGMGNRGMDLIGVTIAALISWMVWIGLTLVIGTKVMPGSKTHADIGEVMRATGFSAAPGILRIFGSLPAVGWPIFLGATFWMFLAFVVAIRQAMDYEGFGRAFAVCVLGWLIHGLIFFAFTLTAM